MIGRVETGGSLPLLRPVKLMRGSGSSGASRSRESGGSRVCVVGLASELDPAAGLVSTPAFLRDVTRARETRAQSRSSPRAGDLDSPVVPGRDERRALNEASFRDFNERIVEQVKDTAGEQAPFNIVCECASPTCTKKIVVTPAEYELLHEDPRQFIVALGHVDS